MYDFEVAFFLYKMSKIQSVFFDSQYKAKAYFAAAMAVDAYDRYIEEMYDKNELRQIPHVGSKIEACIIEILETGGLAELRTYEETFGICDYSLLLSFGLSDKLIKKLWGLSITSGEDLLDSHKWNRLQDVLDKRDRGRLQHFREHYLADRGLYLVSYGKCLAKELRIFLEGCDGAYKVRIAGELARVCEKVHQIDIEVWTDQEADYYAQRLQTFSRVGKLSRTEENKILGETRFGLPFCILCKRVSDAGQGQENAEFADSFVVRGDLHTHTSATDGNHSLAQMAEAAGKRGYEYLAVTDHTAAMKFAHGLSENEALNQIEEIHELNKNSDVRILAGIEVDILEDGSLDFCDSVLSRFDFVVAAIHTHMNQPPMVLYDRLEKALANPYVNILAHPTGRLLGRPGVLFGGRPPYELDVEQIIQLCKRNHVVMEVNCFPERLDLNMEHMRMAAEQGVMLSLGTDAHSLAHLCNIEYGEEMVRVCRIPAEMVLNMMGYKELISFFNNQREKPESSAGESVQDMKKDFVHYFGNNPAIIQGEKTIIGIDLTGTEEKASGWSYLAGRQARCRRIGTNQEIIDSIKQLKPDIVSIDSPLAYPKGRCCADKNCKCSRYGIMRNSERLLRHFGITVYPCLIDSMIKLTTRGMKLARELREMGFQVIESYPGVAQDILMIPRKGKTKEQFEHLKRGLASFGIEGDLRDNPEISHDEVDAITSALVGYFYLNGQYVGLGNEEEDYLIVPRIQEELLKKRVIIGLSGETGAGKTTVTEYLHFKYGLQSFRYSKVIEELYQISDKEELQKIGAQIARDSQKQRGLSQYMIKKMKPGLSYVIDGLRHMEDYEELRNCFGEDFLFIYIDCSFNNRYKRYNKLKLGQISLERFRQINDHVSESGIVALSGKADGRINNNKGFTELRAQVDKRVKGEKAGGK